ncbi:class I SAM-dependent methyltransferase [Aminobacter aminovorans]|uniref:class I SAM-dependent methyltransferase n=1 Tax=Aminobacter aminovorans TaxID=83263 RepID=UPI00285FBD74|nr:class I SAM-dependent methyltransferase [Aminobacter aminovorans]MDR7222778.1 trans-aconitate methyltransferase [Aminobacter aminovorans]
MDFRQIAEIYSAYERTTLSTEIHPNDVMFNTGSSHYYTVGKSGMQAILTGLSLTWRSQVSRVLDLPCGHGRVARHLRAAFPLAEMFFSDIDHEGADFCAREFAGKAVHSAPDLTKVSLPSDLDVIWIGSLFTHLDKGRTIDWLTYLSGHLSEHGILVTTFHGYFSEKHTAFGGGADEELLRRQFHFTGFGYTPYKTYNDITDYGVSLSKPSTILDIADSIPGMRASYMERGWANNHDVLVLCKNDRLASF